MSRMGREVLLVVETSYYYYVESETDAEAVTLAEKKFEVGEPDENPGGGWSKPVRSEVTCLPDEDRTFSRGPWRLEWEHHGEGYDGDYNEEDPKDKALLRADLYYKNKMCCDGSYCTLASVDTPTKQLQKYSNDLFNKLERGMKTVPNFVDEETAAEDRFDEVKFNDRVMQEWTWRTQPAKTKSRSKAKGKRLGRKKVK